MHKHRFDTISVAQLIQVFYRTVNAGNKPFFDAYGIYVELFSKLTAQRRRKVRHFIKIRYPFFVQPTKNLPRTKARQSHFGSQFLHLLISV